MARTVSFINYKGGVGKTTICVEIAASLVMHEDAKVLIIDLDPQTNATFYLMKIAEWEEHSIKKGTLKNFFEACIEGKENEFDLQSILYKYDKHNKGKNLHIIPSHLELFGMDLHLAQKYGHSSNNVQLFLRDALKNITNNYDFIFIDCPPNIYLSTQNGLFASDDYVIVALAEYLSTIGLGHIQREIKTVFDKHIATIQKSGVKKEDIPMKHPNLLGIIFNRVRTVTGGTALERSTIEQIRKQYKDTVFKNYVSQSTQIAGRVEETIPISFSKEPQAKQYSMQMYNLAKEFLDRITKP